MRQVSTLLFAAPLAAALLLTSPRPAGAADTNQTVHASAEGWIAGSSYPEYVGQMDSMSLHCSVGGGGLLHGTMDAALIAWDVSGEPGAPVGLEGDLWFTNRHGQLRVAVHCTLDLATGEFTATGAVAGGTETFDGASGTVSVHGYGGPDYTLELDEVDATLSIQRP